MRLPFFAVLLSLLSICCLQAHACNLDTGLEQKIAANTFKLVPIRQAMAEYTPEQAHRYYQKNCSRSDLPVNERMNCELMRVCADQNCAPVFGSHGTSFLVNNGKTLVSAWHVSYPSHEVALNFLSSFLQTMSAEELKAAYSGLGPSFVLLNQRDEIVYDTRHPEIFGETRYVSFGDPLTPLFHEQGQKGNTSFGYFENITEDYVRIELGKSLGPGLQQGAHPTTNEECYFGAGFVYDGREEKYRVFTGRRESLTRLKQSTEKFLEFSLKPLPAPQAQLEALPTVDLLERLGYSAEAAKEQTKMYSEETLREATTQVFAEQRRHMRDLKTEMDPRVLFLSMPITSGQSGGPLLNTRGEVIGILTNGVLVKGEKGVSVTSHGGGALRMEITLEQPRIAKE